MTKHIPEESRYSASVAAISRWMHPDQLIVRVIPIILSVLIIDKLFKGFLMSHFESSIWIVFEYIEAVAFHFFLIFSIVIGVSS